MAGPEGQNSQCRQTAEAGVHIESTGVAGFAFLSYKCPLLQLMPLMHIKQAADRFMHMLELHGGPEHLVVFITSDQDFCEKIQELQRRNFRVVVLYHGPSASYKPVSINSVADESHDWLTFLSEELGMSHLSVAPYDPQAYHGAHQSQSSCTSARAAPSLMRQPSHESRYTERVSG